MAKIREADAKIKFETIDDVDKIQWIRVNEDSLMRIDEKAMNDKYDFYYMPEHLRRIALARLLEWAYETYRLEHFRKERKKISQNNFASTTVRIDPQLFSTHKTGLRNPSIDSIDTYATFFGPFIYDMLGLARRMPRNRELNEIVDILSKSDDRFRAEILERARNYLDNKAESQSP